MKWLNTYNNILFAATMGTISVIILIILAITSLSIFSDGTSENRGIDQKTEALNKSPE